MRCAAEDRVVATACDGQAGGESQKPKGVFQGRLPRRRWGRGDPTIRIVLESCGARASSSIQASQRGNSAGLGCPCPRSRARLPAAPRPRVGDQDRANTCYSGHLGRGEGAAVAGGARNFSPTAASPLSTERDAPVATKVAAIICIGVILVATTARRCSSAATSVSSSRTRPADRPRPRRHRSRPRTEASSLARPGARACGG